MPGLGRKPRRVCRLDVSHGRQLRVRQSHVARPGCLLRQQCLGVLDTPSLHGLLGIFHRRRLGADHFGFKNAAQSVEYLGLRLLEEACSELVQQTADIFCRIQEGLRVFGSTAGLQLHMLQRMFQQTGRL